MKKENSNSISEISLPFPARFGLTLLGCTVVYSIISLHFFLAVKTAFFLGDAAYLPPSVLHFTSVIFRVAEISAFVEIVFLVMWLTFIGFTCWAMFKFAVLLKDSLGSIFFDDQSDLAAYTKCFNTAFCTLLPVLILSLLTLAITPIQSHKYEMVSMSEIAEIVSFSRFLTAMDEGTIALFGVTVFVILVLIVAYLQMKFLPDNMPVMFIAVFVGVIIGVFAMMPLMWFGARGFEFINLKTGSSHLSHFALFAIYSIVSAIFILPVLNKKKKTTVRKLPT